MIQVIYMQVIVETVLEIIITQVRNFMTQKTPTQSPLINGPIYLHSKILQNVLSSAAESDLDDLFVNEQKESPSTPPYKNMDTHKPLHQLKSIILQCMV